MCAPPFPTVPLYRSSLAAEYLALGHRGHWYSFDLEHPSKGAFKSIMQLESDRNLYEVGPVGKFYVIVGVSSKGTVGCQSPFLPFTSWQSEKLCSNTYLCNDTLPYYSLKNNEANEL